jgi:hypothetical protein
MQPLQAITEEIEKTKRGRAIMIMRNVFLMAGVQR